MPISSVIQGGTRKRFYLFMPFASMRKLVHGFYLSVGTYQRENACLWEHVHRGIPFVGTCRLTSPVCGNMSIQPHKPGPASRQARCNSSSATTPLVDFHHRLEACPPYEKSAPGGALYNGIIQAAFDSFLILVPDMLRDADREAGR